MFDMLGVMKEMILRVNVRFLGLRFLSQHPLDTILERVMFRDEPISGPIHSLEDLSDLGSYFPCAAWRARMALKNLCFGYAVLIGHILKLGVEIGHLSLNVSEC